MQTVTLLIGTDPCGLGRGQSLEHMREPLLTELLEHLLVFACHFTGVAFDPKNKVKESNTLLTTTYHIQKCSKTYINT